MTEGAGAAALARIASWLLFATVALAPLPFGSVEATTTALWCFPLGACLVLAPVRSLNGGRFLLVCVAASVIAAYALVLHQQLSEHPWFAAMPDPVWGQAATALGMPLTPSVSIARHEPWFALGRPLVCVLAAACGFMIGIDQGAARQLIKVIAWSGVVYAAYGILAHIFDPGHILWLDKKAYLESVTGTFVNRNTAGAYFGSCAVVWFLLFWERAWLEMPRGPLDWRAMAAHLLSTPSKRVGVAFAMTFVCLTAMFMTNSRGAVLFSLLALVVAFAAFFRRDLPSRVALVSAIVGSAAVAVLLLEFMGTGVNARFDAQGLADEGRFETYKATLRMVAEHPWLGTGLGTFKYAFPAYRSAGVSVWGVWDMAHNTLLEIAADMGVPIAILVVVVWIVIFSVLLRGVFVRRRGLLVPVAALAVGMLAVLHSLIDFSLQIPGYAIVAMSLIGAGLAQSFGERRSQNGTPPVGVGSRAGDPLDNEHRA